MHGTHTSAQAHVYINKAIFSEVFVLFFLYMSFEHAEDMLYDQAPSSLHSFATSRYLKTLVSSAIHAVLHDCLNE